MRAPDLLSGPPAGLPGFIGALENRSHQPRSMIEIGLRPLTVGGIRICPGADRTEVVVHQIADVRFHEVDVSRIASGDHWTTEVHGFSQGEPEALSPVQGYIAVATRDQSVLLTRRKVALVYMHVSVTIRMGEQQSMIVTPLMGVDHLYDQ